MKRFLYFLAWTVAIGFIIYVGGKYQLSLEEEANATFSVLPVVWFSTVFPIIIGMLLRLPKLINEIKQNKQWAFDWIKFTAIGLPSFLLSFVFVFLFYFPESMLPFIPHIVLENSIIHLIAGIVFGYIVLDSLKKY